MSQLSKKPIARVTFELYEEVGADRLVVEFDAPHIRGYREHVGGTEDLKLFVAGFPINRVLFDGESGGQ